ncbi:3-methyl-2-oxobutanoate hydroxymethyltransferase [Kribbella voronezhensis]|uniref:3-methyl-2-oxobutanoate hydroxymethyltransferase n=1 Tax=Kribbella voronezhensis TaxID=2512212 RepID=A0A4R7T6E9_9ACTN|nr:3-methyl-2-oxobutanoate hydroxymethyltransferase [Kribbella voronezhensis]
MVDNFMSAGTNGDADDELPAPYGTGPKNRTTEEHHRSDYSYTEPDRSGDGWRDRSTALDGLDPAPSLPNAPRSYERGPVPQQPYVPKPPFLPGPPPAAPSREQGGYQGQQQSGQQYGEQPYSEPSRSYGDSYSEPSSDRYDESPFAPRTPYQEPTSFRPQQPPASSQGPQQGSQQASPPSQSPFAPNRNGTSGHPPQPAAPSTPRPSTPASNGLSSNGTVSSSSAQGPAQSAPRPPQPQSSNGSTAHGAGSNGWIQPSPPSTSQSQPSSQSQTGALSNGLSQQSPPRAAGPAPTRPAPSAPSTPNAPNAPSPAAPAASSAPTGWSGQAPSTGQTPNASNGYPSDPSAEYESNAPISSAATPSTRNPAPSQQSPATPQAPAAQQGGSRPVGARRRADVQQDAPSQVPEPAASHRAARRAQPIASTAPGESAGTSASPSTPSTPGDSPNRPRRYRIHHLRDMKNRGEKWAMLTAYDQYTAEIFDESGIPVLLVGDSAANNVYGYDTTLRVTVDELIPLARAVASAVQRALVVADLPFGSYQGSPEQAFHTAVRFMKEAGVHAVKLEGGRTVVPAVEKLTQAGIPVMAHIGFTPQSEHSIGGYRVQGRGDQAAGLIDDAVALAEAGAFSVVLEMVPGDVAAEITKRISVPTIGIGAGRDTDAQVLVWQDMAGLRSGPMPRFVKQYADLRSILTTAATTYAAEVASGAFPTDDHTF